METVNIFLSSTFEDMDYVRNSIQSLVFPEFQEYCILNDLICNLIDLRWGVSLNDEKAKNVISKCLDDIEYCGASPLFFIGIIGKRYGWSPDKSDFKEEIVVREPLVELAVKNQWSVTELECRYAEKIKGDTSTIYFIYEEDGTDLDPRLIEFKHFLKSNGNVVVTYKDQAEISPALLTILKDWLFKYCNILPEHQNAQYLIEKYYGSGASVSEICQELSLGSQWDQYHGFDGISYQRTSVLAIDVFAHRQAKLKLRDALNSLAPAGQKVVKDYIFSLLSLSPLDGLSLEEIIGVLEKVGIDGGKTKSVFELIRPFLREYKGKYKTIHPRLEGVEAFGLTEKINPVLDELINYYQNNDMFVGDQHVVHTFAAKARMNFLWRMGGATHGPRVLGNLWSEFSDIKKLKEHYSRRKNLVYSVFLMTFCIDFQLYKKFSKALEQAARESTDKDFFVTLIEDENIQRDFPLITNSIGKGLQLDESDLDLLSQRHKNYRKLCGDIVHDLGFNWDRNLRGNEPFDSFFGYDYWLEYEEEIPPGLFLHQLLLLLRHALDKGEIPYTFKLFSRLQERHGLEG